MFLLYIYIIHRRIPTAYTPCVIFVHGTVRDYLSGELSVCEFVSRPISTYTHADDMTIWKNLYVLTLENANRIRWFFFFLLLLFTDYKLNTITRPKFILHGLHVIILYIHTENYRPGKEASSRKAAIISEVCSFHKILLSSCVDHKNDDWRCSEKTLWD